MKNIFVIVLFACGFCINPMPNIQYIAYGYNILNGNPHTTESSFDPGFTQPIFGIAYEKKTTSDDKRFLVPDNMSASKEISANVEFKTDLIAGTEKYSESVSQEFGLNLEGWGAKFRISKDYQKVHSKTESSRTVFSYSKGYAQVYKTQIGVAVPPLLTNEFLLAADHLPEKYTEKSYMDLIDSFGTHYASVMYMGARFATQSSVNEKSYKELFKKGINISIASSAFAYGISDMLDNRTEEQKHWASEYEKRKENYAANIIGVRPVPKKTVNEWLEKVIEGPMPIQYTMLPLNKLFNPNNFYRRYNNEKLANLMRNVETALKNYCEYKKKQGLIKSCESPIHDPPYPDPLVTCRLCWRNHENPQFPVFGGVFIAETNSTDRYHLDCKEPYDPYGDYPYASLWCESADKTKVGDCRLCSSCGGSYPTRAGAMADKYRAFWNFKKECEEPWSDYGTKNISLCCKTPEPSCTICNSCGGQWPVETGGFHIEHHTYNRTSFEGRGKQCSGEVHFLDNLERKYICCKAPELP